MQRRAAINLSQKSFKEGPTDKPSRGQQDIKESPEARLENLREGSITRVGVSSH
jgi:hypothetical protein